MNVDSFGAPASGPAAGGGPNRVPLWNLPWLDAYPVGVPSSLDYPNIPVSGLLERAAAAHGPRTCSVFFDHQASYAQTLDAARRFAHALRDLGVGPGDRVGLILPNAPEYIVALNGIWLAGGVAVQLSPLLVTEEIGKLLELTDCHTVVTLDVLAPPLRALRGESRLRRLIVTSLEDHLDGWKRWLYPLQRVQKGGTWRLGEMAGVYRFDRLVRSASPEPPRLRLRPDRDLALIQPTGGTTGSPKGVALTHRNLVANALQLVAWVQVREGEETILAALPLFHAYALTVCLLAGTAMASTIILLPRYQTAQAIGLIERYRPSIFPTVPAMLVAMNRYLAEHPADLSSLRAVISGASALEARVRDQFMTWSAGAIVEGYGLSEASPVTHVNPMDAPLVGSIGLPLPDTRARIVDAATGSIDLVAGEVGELIVQGPQVMAGYLNDTEATARAIRDGWLYTGDLATMDPQGFFRIVDRKKDLIKTAGYNVFPLEVEEAIGRHPAVAEVAVIGVPDPDRGELVKAIIVPRAGQALSQAEVQQFCRAHLAKHKQPRIIEFRTRLPRNFLGKVQRARLRDEPEDPPDGTARGVA